MPCQDTLFEIRMGNDPGFADAVGRDQQARNAAVILQERLCNVGRRLATGQPIDAWELPAIPEEPGDSFADEWGERIRQMAIGEIAAAKMAARHLADISSIGVTHECRNWLIDHWKMDLNRLERDNERHKREIQTPRYRSGPKHDKRVQRITDDSKEIAELEHCIKWAEAA